MKITFKKDSKDFHKSINKAVDEYFKNKNTSKKANAFMYFKTSFYISALLASYFSLLFGGFQLWVNNLLWIGLGLSSVFIAVNCGHDAIHGAYSSKKWVNSLVSKSYDLLGANSYLWGITHNIVHHTYTSIQGADEDIQSVPFTRLTPYQKWRPYHKYQHFYVFFLYSFSTLFWVFTKDYKKFYQNRIGNYNTKKHPSQEYFNLFFYKAIYYFIFLAVPLMVIDMPWYSIVIGFVLGHLAEGITIATIFALAHIVEEAQFYLPDQQGSMEHNWAVHQLHTTVDFGRKSALTSFFTGGLNFQIEHHLFPTICHVHYPAISEIVKKIAAQHMLPYNECPSFIYAIKSHIALLKKLGNNKVIERIDPC